MSHRKDIYIVKANGERELFDTTKLHRSLVRAGAHESLAKKIIDHVTLELKNNMQTTDIYRHAFSLLHKYEDRPIAARYAIRRAILELGPSGYPFEEYVAKIYEALGYQCEIQQIIKGKCAEHEVDILAHKGGEIIAAELKFHNSLGIKTDLKVALYVKARFEDIRANANDNLKTISGGLITNTKFTKRAISYGKCAELFLLGWNYPAKRNLQTIIEETRVYPITTLASLNRREKESLLNQHIVLCKDLEINQNALKRAGVKTSKIATIISESQSLCSL